MILVLFYSDPPIQSSFYFDPFVPAEVKDEIKVLPNNKAYGLYSCTVSILKLSSHIISQPLAQIFNVSVSSRSFPAKLKTAKVVPVFKSGDESKPGNYRPISLFNYQFSTEYLKSWFIKDLLSLLINIIYYIHHNMDSAVGIVHSTQL